MSAIINSDTMSPTVAEGNSMPQPIWAWAILGLVLLSIELLSGTFYILWFGISALCVALMLAIYPNASLPIQLLGFSIISLTSLALWRRKYKMQGPGLRIGQSSDDTIGKLGRVTAEISPAQNGTITFTIPVMSSREWTAIADEQIAAGEEAEVVGIEGNFLRVRRRTKF
jgi:inner membrane protein